MEITKKRRHLFLENTPNFIFGEIKIHKVIRDKSYWIDSSRLTINFHYIIRHHKIIIEYNFEHHVEYADDDHGLRWMNVDRSEEQIIPSDQLFQYAYALANDEVIGVTEEYMFNEFVSRYLVMKCQK